MEQEDFLYTPPAQEIMHGEDFWTAYFSVLVPASMKAIKYRVVIKVKCVETKIVEILSSAHVLAAKVTLF